MFPSMLFPMVIETHMYRGFDFYFYNHNHIYFSATSSLQWILLSSSCFLGSCTILYYCRWWLQPWNHCSQNHCRWWLQPWNKKTLTPWKESYDQPRQHIKKQRHYFANTGLSSQGYDFSSGHIWMWELDYKESWALKNWCFWTVVLEKTLESPLDCK